MTAAPSHLRSVGAASDAPVTVPPSDLDAEGGVLSIVMIDPTALPKIADFLKPEHFYSEAHRRIYEAAIALRTAGEPIDNVQVGTWLNNRKRLAQVGGFPYLTELLNCAPSMANIVAYALTVFEKWRARQVITICQAASAKGYLDYGDTQTYVDSTTRALAGIASQQPFRPVESNRQALDRLLSQVIGADDPENVGTNDEIGFPSGIPSLDRVLGGFIPGHKFTLAGSTGDGKTAFAGHVGAHVAGHGVGVLFFSTEIKRSKVLFRLACSMSGVSSARVKAVMKKVLDPKTGAPYRLTDDEADRWLAALERIAALPLVIDERASVTIEDIRACVAAEQERSMQMHKVPLGLVIVDYIQRLPASRGQEQWEKHEQIEHKTKTFKMMCQDFNVAGLELAQSKTPKKTSGKRPRPTKEDGVADCSQVAKEADELVFIVAEDKERIQRLTLVIAKGRDGGEGQEIALDFVKDLIRFEDAHNPLLAASRAFVAPASFNTEGM